MTWWTPVLWGLVAALSWAWWRRVRVARGVQGPPGPRGLPLLGSLLALDARAPHAALARLAARYGPATSLRLGSLPALILTDPRLVREAFAKDAFCGRAPLYLTHGIMKGNGIICAEGELWKDQRRLLSAWLRTLGATRTAARRPDFELRLNDAVDALEQRLSRRPDPLAPLDPQALMADSIGALVHGLVYGGHFREGDPTWAWLLHINEEGCRHMGVAAIVNFLPFLRFFMPSIHKTMDTIVSGQSQSHEIHKSIVETRRKLRKAAAEGKIPDGDYNAYMDAHPEIADQRVKCAHLAIQGDAAADCHYFQPHELITSSSDCILDRYLEEQERRRMEAPEGAATARLSDKQLLFLLADLFGAGLDTTMVSLSWFLLFMALHPEEQEIVRAEVKSECGERAPLLEDQSRLPRTKAALHEAQRLRPVVPVGIPHGCVEDSALGEWTIPRGTMIIPLQYALHTDAAAWPEPHAYRPARFLGPAGELLNPPHFMPFQTGKRMCPGDELARSMLFLWGARLVGRYQLTLDGPPPDMAGVMGLTLAPPPYRLKVRPLHT